MFSFGTAVSTSSFFAFLTLFFCAVESVGWLTTGTVGLAWTIGLVGWTLDLVVPLYYAA